MIMLKILNLMIVVPRLTLKIKSESTETPRKPIPVPQTLPNTRRKKKQRIGRSDPYFITLLLALLLALSRLWIYPWIIKLLPILIVIYIVKNIWINFRVSELLQTVSKDHLDALKNWAEYRMDAIMPGSLRALFQVLLNGDRKIMRLLQGSIGKLISVLIILCLILLASFASVFFIYQVHHESSYLIKVATDLDYKTLTANEDFLKYLDLNVCLFV